MSMPVNYPDEVDASYPWYQPLGFRTWTISAHHNGKTIVEYSENCKNNHIKLSAFREKLSKEGFVLSPEQLKNMKGKLSIDFVVADCEPSDLRRMCKYCGVETDINKVCKYSRSELDTFAAKLGLQFDELEDVLVKHGNGTYVRV